MELWIRSQDKLTLMKTTYVYVAREEVCAYDENKCWSTIGVYKSQERALKVLDEIQNMICPKIMINLGEGTIVYQMPED